MFFMIVQEQQILASRLLQKLSLSLKHTSNLTANASEKHIWPRRLIEKKLIIANRP